MAASTSRTIFHFTPKKITAFQNSPKDQLKLLRIHGKPLGFWYAYGTDWKNLVEKEKTGRSRNTVALKYEMTLPEEFFVSDIEKATPNTIFELSDANLDAFMKRFHQDDYLFSKKEIIRQAFIKFVQDGGSAVLNELTEADNTGTFQEHLDEIQEEISNLNDMNNLPDYEKEAYKYYSELFEEVDPSPAALRSDQILNYDWTTFWKNIASSVGGVEFHTNLFTIKEWNGLWLPWTDKLDVRSGVIFHPSEFGDGIVVEQILTVDPVAEKSGGRRRTRRRTRRDRERKRHQTRRQNRRQKL